MPGCFIYWTHTYTSLVQTIPRSLWYGVFRIWYSMVRLPVFFATISRKCAILFLQIQALADDSIHQSRSSINGPENIIDTLIVFTVNTGVITCSASTAHLVSFLASPNTAVHFTFHFVLSKLYTNGLYASLNTRASFRRNEETNRSAHGTSSREWTFTRRSMLESPVIATYGASVSHLPFPT